MAWYCILNTALNYISNIAVPTFTFLQSKKVIATLHLPIKTGKGRLERNILSLQPVRSLVQVLV